ncbi:MAG: FG-GAP-like repeat-containing protein [Polyangiales bacterium]
MPSPRVERAAFVRCTFALVSIACVSASCRSPATQVVLVMDTDAQRERPMSVEVLSFKGLVRPSEIATRALTRVDGIARFERNGAGEGSFVAGGSVGVLPASRWLDSMAADRGVATLWIRAVFAATDRAPEVRTDRVAQVSFVRNRSGTARIVLPVRCGDPSVGCVSVAPSQCTVSVRCREQNATCGDQGQCVSPELSVDYGDDAGASEGGAPVDAETGRSNDAAVGADSALDASTDSSMTTTSDGSMDVANDSASDSGSDDASDGGGASIDGGDGAAVDALDVLSPCEPAGRTRCDGVCVDLATSVEHCGACGNACPSTANASPACVRSSCAIVCDSGFVRVGDRCVMAGTAPRPIAPLSLGETTLLRPTLRWQLPAPLDGATVELCADRGCTAIIEMLTVTGTEARPTRNLPARRAIFWRLRGRIGGLDAGAYGPTWLFHTPAVDATTGVDSSAAPHTDFNGDGFDDVVVGAPDADPGGLVNAGSAHVFMGYPPGVTPSSMLVLDGDAAGIQFGFAVAGAGDLNGDGYGDLVVGAYRADPGARMDAGAAWVYYGSPIGLRARADRALEGVATNDLFAYSVASGGDVNGDGYADLLVGSNSGSHAGVDAGGTLSLYAGSPTGIAAAPTLVLGGATMGDGFGVSVASAGDVNGDGFSDVIVGAWSAARMAGPDAGSASVFHGSATGLSVAPAVVLDGLADRDYFGRTIASAGDVDNDGYSDVLVGAYYADYMGRSDAGTTGLYLGGPMGVSSTPARVIGGGAIRDYLGISTSSAGDLNGDGFDDVVIGAYFASPGGRGRAGHTQVFYGNATGINAAADGVIEGLLAGDILGVSMSPAGDVNGDGYADVLIGASQADPMGRVNAGTAQLHFGSAMGIALTPSVTLAGPNSGDGFGYGLASVLRGRRASARACFAGDWARRRSGR